jgi:hypothetical protein
MLSYFASFDAIHTLKISISNVDDKITLNVVDLKSIMTNK